MYFIRMSPVQVSMQLGYCSGCSYIYNARMPQHNITENTIPNVWSYFISIFETVRGMCSFIERVTTRGFKPVRQDCTGVSLAAVGGNTKRSCLIPVSLNASILTPPSCELRVSARRLTDAMSPAHSRRRSHGARVWRPRAETAVRADAFPTIFMHESLGASRKNKKHGAILLLILFCCWEEIYF